MEYRNMTEEYLCSHGKAECRGSKDGRKWEATSGTQQCIC